HVSDTKSALNGGRLLHRRSAVEGPAQHKRAGSLDAQGLAWGHDSYPPMELPYFQVFAPAFAKIALGDRRQLVEYFLVPNRAQQLDILGMGPYQRHGGAARFSKKHENRRDIGLVPDLFGQHEATTGTDGEFFHGGNQRPDFAASRQFVMSAFAGQERPSPAFAVSVVR